MKLIPMAVALLTLSVVGGCVRTPPAPAAPPIPPVVAPPNPVKATNKVLKNAPKPDPVGTAAKINQALPKVDPASVLKTLKKLPALPLPQDLID